MRSPTWLCWVLLVPCVAIGAEARGGRRGPPSASTYVVVQPPPEGAPDAWGLIQGTCRLSHPVVAQPMEFGLRDDREDGVAQTALADPKTLTLSNCIVSITKISAGKSRPSAPTHHVIERVGSRYVPRVTRYRTRRDRLSVVSRDPESEYGMYVNTSHSGHVGDAAPKNVRISVSHSTPRVHLLRDHRRVGMRGYVWASTNPYTTDPTTIDGRFVLSHVPPGTYTLSCWHEGLGVWPQRVAGRVTGYMRDRSFKLTREIEVKPGQALTVNWTIPVPTALRHK